MKPKKQGIGFIGWVLRLSNLLIIIALLISYLANYVNPNDVWMVAFFGIMFPVLAIINLFFILFWLLRRKLFVILPILVFLLGFNLIGKYLRFGGGEKLDDDKFTFKVLSYNVHTFDFYSKTFGEEGVALNKIVDFIKEEKPDIMCFQEFFSHNKKDDWNQFKLFKREFPQHFVYKKTYNEKTDNSYLVIFSKFPVINSGFIETAPDNEDITAIYVDIMVDTTIMRIYTTHLNSTYLSPKKYLLEREYDLTKKEDAKVAASGAKDIIRRMKKGYMMRGKQVEMLENHLENCPYPYIITGDFNDPPNSYSYHQLVENLKDSYIEAGFGFGNTYAGKYPSFRIDYIFHDDFIRAVKFKRFKLETSDHYPIVSTFTFNEQNQNE